MWDADGPGGYVFCYFFVFLSLLSLFFVLLFFFSDYIVFRELQQQAGGGLAALDQRGQP